MRQIVTALTEEPGGEHPPVIELVGVDPAVRRGLAACAAHEVGTRALRAHPRTPGRRSRSTLSELTRLWERETLLLPVLLYVDVADLRAGETHGIDAAPRGSARPVARRAAVSRGRCAGDGCGSSTSRARRPRSRRRCGTPCWATGRPRARALAARVRSQPVGDRRRRAPGRARAAPARRGAVGGVPCAGAAATGHPRRARRARPRRGTTSSCPTEELRLLRHLVDQVRGRSTVLRRGAWPSASSAAAASPRCSPARAGTGKTHGRRGARRRARARPLPDRPRRRWSASTSARPRRTCAACSTPPRTAARSCSSTRPTRSSASAARSRTATTATPTSRSTTCCSAWRPTAGWRSWPPTCRHALDDGVPAAAALRRPLPVPGAGRARARSGRGPSRPRAPVDGLDVERLARLAATRRR